MLTECIQCTQRKTNAKRVAYGHQTFKKKLKFDKNLIQLTLLRFAIRKEEKKDPGIPCQYLFWR
jgi:hypothetical protein